MTGQHHILLTSLVLTGFAFSLGAMAKPVKRVKSQAPQMTITASQKEALKRDIASEVSQEVERALVQEAGKQIQTSADPVSLAQEIQTEQTANNETAVAPVYFPQTDLSQAQTFAAQVAPSTPAAPNTPQSMGLILTQEEMTGLQNGSIDLNSLYYRKAQSGEILDQSGLNSMSTLSGVQVVDFGDVNSPSSVSQAQYQPEVFAGMQPQQAQITQISPQDFQQLSLQQAPQPQFLQQTQAPAFQPQQAQITQISPQDFQQLSLQQAPQPQFLQQTQPPAFQPQQAQITQISPQDFQQLSLQQAPQPQFLQQTQPQVIIQQVPVYINAPSSPIVIGHPAIPTYRQEQAPEIIHNFQSPPMKCFADGNCIPAFCSRIQQSHGFAPYQPGGAVRYW